jgi:5-methyltetrahydropteroyltriglutamate--homocysteine methyltransferase
MKAQPTPDLKRIRSDVVGSLLRPPSWKQARARFDEGTIDPDEFRTLEDEAIRNAVRLQESAGLEVVTDGELRRLNFQDSFGASVLGFAAGSGTLRLYEQRVEGATPLQRWEIPHLSGVGAAVAQRRPVTERLRLVRNLPLEEYLFVSRVATKPAKVTLIGPDRICQRFDHHGSTAVYPSVEDFLADIVAIERAVITGLVSAGCGHIQIDARAIRPTSIRRRWRRCAGAARTLPKTSPALSRPTPGSLTDFLA